MNHLLAIIFFITIGRISGLAFVPPYISPSNPVVLEGEPLTISCSAADSATFPNVSFQKVGSDGTSYEDINITSSRVGISYTNRNDTTHGLTTTAVLHVTNASFPGDGDSNGMSYKCVSTILRTKKELSFTVYVVRRIDLPKAVVKDITTTYGGSAKLTCDVTYKGNPSTVQLKKVEWLKNSTVIGQGSDAIDPITITKATTRDGGDYVCGAEVSLMKTKMKKITLGTAKLNIDLKMFNGSTKVVGNLSGNAVIVCPAAGYPLNVMWMRVNKDGHEISLREIPRFRGRYVVTRPCPWCSYRLIIYNLQPRDQGHFVCKATSNSKSARYHIKLEFPQEKTVETTVKTNTPTKEPTTKKPGPLIPTIIYAVLGIVILFLLVLCGFLIYRLWKNPHTNLEKADSDTIPLDNKKTVIKTINETSKHDDDENPASVELEPLIANPSADETKEDTDTKASKEPTPKVLKESIATPETSADEVKATKTKEIEPGKEDCECVPDEIKKEPSAHSKTQQNSSSKAANEPGYCILS